MTLVKGGLYTIRGYSLTYSGYVAVLLNEARAPQIFKALCYEMERGFYRDRFRLLDIPPNLLALQTKRRVPLRRAVT